MEDFGSVQQTYLNYLGVDIRSLSFDGARDASSEAQFAQWIPGLWIKGFIPTSMIGSGNLAHNLLSAADRARAPRKIENVGAHWREPRKNTPDIGG